MEDFKNYKKILNLKGTLVDTKDIEDFLLHNSLLMERINRLPQIIDLKKDYKEFSVENILNSEKKLVLVKKDSSLEMIDVKITLHYEYFTYKEILREILPSEVEIPQSYQTVGTILHVNLDSNQFIYKNIIGEVLLNKNKYIKTVITKIGVIDTVFRYFDIEVLAGVKCLHTYHQESGCTFFIDYEKVYWNSKLQDERNRLLKQFKKNDIICDPFCGVGPVVIRAAKLGCKVYCNDLNPVAIDCLKKNIRLNKVCERKIEAYNMDAKDFLLLLADKEICIDHFFFNLPELSLEFVKYLKNYGSSFLHCYFFCKKNVDVNEFIQSYFKADMNKCTLDVCRNVSPNKFMYVLRGKIKHLNIKENN